MLYFGTNGVLTLGGMPKFCSRAPQNIEPALDSCYTIRASNETSLIFFRFIKVLFSAWILGHESTMDLVPIGTCSCKFFVLPCNHNMNTRSARSRVYLMMRPNERFEGQSTRLVDCWVYVRSLKLDTNIK
jgi:hypothetical protein